MKKVAVIILTFNGEKYIKDCLGSVVKTDYPANQLDIIVVDNASEDELKSTFQNLKLKNLELIINPENFGFAGGNNIGIKEAISRGAEYVTLLNQDTVVESNWIKEMIKVAEADDEVAAVQARLMLWPEKDKINSLGNHIHYLGFGFSGNYKEQFHNSKFIIHNSEIAYPSGAAVLLKVEVLKKIGLFDEDLFCYHEDLDLGWRMRMAGYKIKLAPEAVVYHKYEFNRSIKKYYFMERNRFIAMLSNYQWGTLLLILPALIVMEAGLFLFSLRSGWWREKIRVYRYFLSLKNWDKIFVKRKEKQSIRQVKDRKIVKYFVGKIEFQEPEMENWVLKYIANPIFNLYWRIVRIMI